MDSNTPGIMLSYFFSLPPIRVVGKSFHFCVWFQAKRRQSNSLSKLWYPHRVGNGDAPALFFSELQNFPNTNNATNFLKPK